MKIIGITGPTGAGKTTALHVLSDLGAVIIDCDQVYHELLERNELLLGELTQRFGRSILNSDGTLDRKALGRIVFADEAELASLNEITHRYIVQEVSRRLERARHSGCRSAAIDAIALLESGLGALCDVVVAVLAPRAVRIRRIMAREGIPEEYAAARVDAQKGERYFRENCTFVLENNEDDTPAQFAQRAHSLFIDILK